MRRVPLVVVLTAALLGLLAAPAFAATFYVSPSGDDDTANIQAAFDKAIAAGPGSTVRLSAGHFYMNSIFVDGFKGSFTGAGKGRTVIDTLRGLDPGRPGVTLLPDPEFWWTCLIGFVHSDVRVSDMRFDITAAEPCEPWGDVGAMQTNLSDVFLVTRDSSSAFDRVGFKAHDGDIPGGFNIAGDIIIIGTGGVHSVTRCSFVGYNGLELAWLTGASLTIGGSAGMGNTFDMYSADCFGPIDFSDSRVEISHNLMRCTVGAVLWMHQGFGASSAAELPPLPAPRYVICDNTMLASHGIYDGSEIGSEGVLLRDDSWLYDEPSRLRATIARNTIALDNLGWGGGIDGIGADDVRVVHNRIFGTGIAGIDAGTDILASFGYPLAPASGWRIIGNDVSGVHPLNAMGGHAAPIWLGTESSHCLVVGGRTPTDVLDEGTDNILINVNELLASSSTRAAAPMTTNSAWQKALPMLKAMKRF